jgi:enoyl-CoA hydratase/carnithine racemase
VLNRPQKLNALTKAMWQALGAAVDALSADEHLRCIILRGAGEKAFSPGNDIAEFATSAATRRRRSTTAGSCMPRRARWPRAGIRWWRRSTASVSGAASRSPRCAICDLR